MLINEGSPGYLVEMAKRDFDLWCMTAGILGMAFKGESDDPRDSLAYKLRKLLLLEAHDILCNEPVRERRWICQRRRSHRALHIFLHPSQRVP